jgi:uncharacterized protein YaaN involved in tellurite resistance
MDPVPKKRFQTFQKKPLETVKNKDLGEIGGLLDKVVVDIKSMEEEEPSGPFGFFKKQVNKLEQMKVKYQSAEKNIDDIAKTLENHQITLMKDISMLDQMYALNEDYYKELSMYIEAGNRKLQKTYQEEIPALEQVARSSNLPMDAQK